MDVALDEFGPRVEIGPEAGGEIVDDDDPIACAHEGICHVRTDEPGSAGNHDLHAVLTPVDSRKLHPSVPIGISRVVGTQAQSACS